VPAPTDARHIRERGCPVQASSQATLALAQTPRDPRTPDGTNRARRPRRPSLGQTVVASDVRQLMEKDGPASVPCPHVGHSGERIAGRRVPKAIGMVCSRVLGNRRDAERPCAPHTRTAGASILSR
jgi:hypothetical protein